ncbi:prepilin-type N-terminal cleavage/methylation domain-containing protein [Pseudomonas sp. CAU 1711]|uniref:pilin n=1 Tax=Pseudomonas sp. CAU 1711 TaxID=3140356 RepID=UPI0032617779
MRKQQGGFTLIELIMVIVILGILAAFALPRFADLGGDARKASLNGLAGSLKSAAAIARSAQLAKGATLGAAVDLDGASIAMVNGYPQALAAGGITSAAGVDTTSYTPSGGAATGGSTVTYTIRTNCTVTYTAATAATDNTAPITAAPVVVVNDGGC